MKEDISLHALVEATSHEPLEYTIYDHSSFSGLYHPRNICVNDPTEQSSRWSSGSHDQSQYITIQLDKPTVACEILFGKFHRSHVCNLKEFKIYGGLSPDTMHELLHKGLVDDNKAEIFPLRYIYQDVIFPIQYIKIIPLATFGANFNYSIWYVEIRGIRDDALMEKVYEAYDKYKEMEAIRLCLKYFRQKNMLDVYSVLQQKVKLDLEHPLVSELHDTLVSKGDFKSAEEIIIKADKQHVFQSYVKEAKYLPTWQSITAFNDDGDAPCARGGHQICMDPDKERIYLFGGWDGKQELSDFWCYHIKDNRWKLISPDTSLQGGPSARSCHGICFDPVRKSIYVIGRYIEACPLSISTVSEGPLKGFESDFYQYFIELDRWIKISENTLLDGGPALLCDHQMCVDPVTKTLYVIGGRIVAPESIAHPYSGFYAYDMDECLWRVIRHEERTTSSAWLDMDHLVPVGRRHSSNGSYVPSPTISRVFKSRAGHSVLMDTIHRCLYIFGGQRGKEFLVDLYCYDLEKETLVEITHDFQKLFGSDAGYTQRATIHPERQEIHVYSGYLQTKPTHVVRHCLWVYSIKQNHWEKVYESDSQDYWQRQKHIEPQPRYAHQFVYHSSSNTHFIFAGHPGDATQPELRLNDFWKLRLAKPDSAQVVHRCLYLLRTRKLRELCLEDNQEIGTILDYLRRYVSPIVNYEDKEEVAQFKSLCADVCLSVETKQDKSIQDTCFAERTNVFQALLTFFPAHMKEPESSLMDAVKIA